MRAPAAPGSIIAVYAQTASGSFLGVTLSVVGAATVTFLVAVLLLKTDRVTDEPDLAEATAAMEAMKGMRSIASAALSSNDTVAISTISSIVFACDAGMGSSAMGASVLRRKIQSAGFAEVSVVNQAISNLTDSYDLVVTHTDLADRARERTPSAIHVTIDDFMNSPEYDEIVAMIARANRVSAPVDDEPVQKDPTAGTDVLALDSIVLSGQAGTRADAINEAGLLLVAVGAVDASYVDSMHERERSISTYMGNGLAIPHGTNAAKTEVRHTGISLLRYPEAIDWNGKPVEFVIGIAATGDDHLALLNRIAQVFVDGDQVARLRAARTTDEVKAVLDPGHD
ncbi:PTS sugar transporter subunit IIA [Nocardia asteroides]|nr:PTS sugar transporter subunit IIA [Nocardia asteroides]